MFHQLRSCKPWHLRMDHWKRRFRISYLEAIISRVNILLGGGFKYLLLFIVSPLLGEMIQFDEHIFQTGGFNHQLDSFQGCIWLLNVSVVKDVTLADDCFGKICFTKIRECMG